MIILNEFSLDGQFKTSNEFLISALTQVKIFRVFNKLNFEVLCNREFFNAMVTETESLVYLLQNNRSDEIRALRSELSKLALQAPFWEDQQIHTCENIYSCTYTDKTCKYGIAESIERKKVVISFDHHDFRIAGLNLKKDGINFEVLNITNFDSTIDWLISNINNVTEDNPKERWKNIEQVKNLIPLDEIKSKIKKKSHEENIILYKTWGKQVALLNFWKFNRTLTNLNDRDVYTKSVSNAINHLTIDTENGTFEIFDIKGLHLGEFNFLGNRTQNKRSHKLTIK